MAKGNICEKCLKTDIKWKVTGINSKGLPEKEINICEDCKKNLFEEPCCGADDRSFSDSIGRERKYEEHCNKCPWKKEATFIGKEEEDKPVEWAKRNEKHTCPGCQKVYNVAVMDHTEENDTFEILCHFITHHKASNKCFWDSSETKQKVQEYRNRFSKWLDFRGQKAGGLGFAVTVNQKKLSLTDLQECKKELLAIPPVDDMVACKAFSYKEEDNYNVETRGMPYKASLVEVINEVIKQKEKNPDKPNDKGKEPKPNEVCERCGASCIIHKTKTSYTIKRKRYIKHKVDFTRESSVWFGTNCPCAKEYREANQQTCPQCKKREFPHMKRGWMLDYEIKKAFCSPLCHVTYRELKWEEAQRLTRVEMFPPELDVETNPNQNTDWEKEGLKREVLFWREYARELEVRLANQNNLTPEQRQQNDYLRNLQQNTLRNAESNYQSRYGSLSEDGSDKGKGLSGGVIALLIIGRIAIVGIIIALLVRNKSKK